MSIKKRFNIESKTNTQAQLQQRQKPEENILMLDVIMQLFCEKEIKSLWINGFNNVRVDNGDHFEKINNLFEDDEQVVEFIKKLAKLTNQSISEENYIIEGRLNSNLMFMAVLPYNYQTEPVLVIKRSYIDILSNDIVDANIQDYFEKIVKCKKNILIVSPEKQGKTTILNLLLNKIDFNTKLIALVNSLSENSLNTNFTRINITPFYENENVRGEFGLNKKFLTYLQNLKPERIALDELNGGDVFEFLKTIDLFFRGSFFTINAANQNDAIMKLEKMITYSYSDLSSQKLKSLLSYAIDIIICVELIDDIPKILGIYEIDLPLEKDYDIKTIFKFDGKDYLQINKPDFSCSKQNIRAKKFDLPLMNSPKLPKLEKIDRLKILGKKMKNEKEKTNKKLSLKERISQLEK